MAQQNDPGKETATLAGGCFWCLEAVYDELRGVERVISGYAGGNVPHPSSHHPRPDDIEPPGS
jgi:peptide-methionine (S)-S-oxide reductase